MDCPFCGTTLRAGAIFCNRCGRRLAPKPETNVVPTADANSTNPSVDDSPPPILSVEDLYAAETHEMSLDALAHVTPSSEDGAIGGMFISLDALISATSGDNASAADVCWNCGAPRASGDDERFCEQCGAERTRPMEAVSAEILAKEGSPAFPAPPPSAENEPEAATQYLETVTIAEPIDDTEIAETTHILDATQFTPQRTPVIPPPPVGEAIPADAPPPVEVHISPNYQNDAPTIEATLFDQVMAGMSPGIFVGIASDVGRARRGRPNEDTAMVMTLTHAGDTPPPPLTLCVVADGLGGHENGQRAGRLAARTITSVVTQYLWLPALSGQAPANFDPADLGKTLRAAIEQANDLIIAINRSEGGDMGCTVTALLAHGDAACIANVGDSRTYRFDGHEISRVTTDHSLVARLVAAGMIAPEEVYSHPNRSQIYRSLGDESDALVVDLFPCRLSPGETYVLCSDGLWEMVRDPMIAETLMGRHAERPQMLAEALVQLANDHGGDDNVSVIVAQVVL